MAILDKIFAPIKDDLALVEEEIVNISPNERYLKPLASYLKRIKGKRIRPALVLLASRLNENNNAKSINLAAQMEIIHSASLIHDDIIDKASLRRGKSTLTNEVGQDVALVLGDFLFSQVFDYLSLINDPKISGIISQVVKKICKGELAQLGSASQFNMPVQTYLESISNKTASFFSACCEIGGLCADANPIDLNILKDYGLYFGMLFQLLDDYMDITGDIDQEKKSLLTDLKTKKITLPIIYLWKSLSDDERRKLFPQNGDEMSVQRIKKIIAAINEKGADKKTVKLIMLYADKSKNSIEPLKDKKIYNNLILLVDYMMARLKTN